MTLPPEFDYLEKTLVAAEYAEVLANDAWEEARKQFLAGDIDFEDYLTAYRLYTATSIEANMLHMRLYHFELSFESGDTLEVREDVDDRAVRLTRRYWLRRFGVVSWLK